MPARIDPFLDVLLREGGEQLYFLPDEPVTMLKGGKPRKVSKQPLTDQHIYALLVEVAPTESADHIDQATETQFEYAADRGLVRVRVVPELGRLTAVIAPLEGKPAESHPPRPSAIAAAPLIESPVPAPSAAAVALPGEFADQQYKAAEQRLGDLLKALVKSASSDLHLRVGEPPTFRTHGEMKRQGGGGPARSRATRSTCCSCPSCPSATASSGRRPATPISPMRFPAWPATASMPRGTARAPRPCSASFRPRS